jgi:hypothetical protein
MNRNKDILSDDELFEKTTDIVEHAINAKITLTFDRGSNFCTYDGVNPDNTKSFTINISSPPVKCIDKYTALLHELGHVLYQSPFTPIKKLLENSKHHSLYFAIFNVLEDQRIESHLSENYIAYRQRFKKTTTALGKNLDESENINDPLFILLAIRFNQEKIVKHVKNFIHYKKALDDVKNTDSFGALRVFISIKKYIEESLVLGSSTIIQNNNYDESDLTHNRAPILRSKHENEMIESLSKMNGSPIDELERNIRKEFGDSSSLLTDSKQVKKIMSDDSDSEDIQIPQELLDESYDKSQIDELLKEGKVKGQKQFLEIREKMLSPDIISDNSPVNVTKIERNEENYAIDYRVSSSLNKLFKKLKMRNKPYVDYHGYEIDIEEYVNNVIRGIDINKSFENRKKSHGSSIVISIDGSSSMDGDKIKIAQKLVATIYESLKGIPKIEVKGNVWSGNTDGDIGVTEINTMKDVKKITIAGKYYTTPTHMGLEYSGQMLKSMKGEKKLLILITDGVPNHFKNGYHLQPAHYNKVCKKSLRKVLGITPNVLCILVNDSTLETSTSFDDSIFKNDPKLNSIRERISKLNDELTVGVKEFIKLFGAKRVIHVNDMDQAFVKVVKQFKNFMQYNAMNFF